MRLPQPCPTLPKCKGAEHTVARAQSSTYVGLDSRGHRHRAVNVSSGDSEGLHAGWIAPRSDAKAVLRLFTSSWMNLLLLTIPFGWLAFFLHWNAIAIFVLVGTHPSYSGCMATRKSAQMLCVKGARSYACGVDSGLSRHSRSKKQGDRHRSVGLRDTERREPQPRMRVQECTDEVVCCLQNFIALIPLALVLGEVTEDLATRFGDVIGGLLNATFGNVVELILSVAALTKGLYTVVAMSLIGSILSNLLLVLGEPPSYT